MISCGQRGVISGRGMRFGCPRRPETVLRSTPPVRSQLPSSALVRGTWCCAACYESRAAYTAGHSVWPDGSGMVWCQREDECIARHLRAEPNWIPRRRARISLSRYIARSQGSAPGRTRTCDQRIRSPTLYPAELRGHMARKSLSDGRVIAPLGSRVCRGDERRTGAKIQGCRSIPVTLSGWFCHGMGSPTRLRA
jgi:hypothetical protein